MHWRQGAWGNPHYQNMLVGVLLALLLRLHISVIISLSLLLIQLQLLLSCLHCALSLCVPPDHKGPGMTSSLSAKNHNSSLIAAMPSRGGGTAGWSSGYTSAGSAPNNGDVISAVRGKLAGSHVIKRSHSGVPKQAATGSVTARLIIKTPTYDGQTLGVVITSAEKDGLGINANNRLIRAVPLNGPSSKGP